MESVAVLGHVSGVLLPIIGPIGLVILSKGRSRLDCQHLRASIFFSTVWVGTVVAIISVDVGHFSIDEQETSNIGLALLLTAAAVMITITSVNIRRAKREQPPFPFGRLFPKGEHEGAV